MLFHVNGDDGGVANAGLGVKMIDDSGSGVNRKEKGVTDSAGGVVVVLDRMRLCRLDARVYFEWNVLGGAATGLELEICATVSQILYRHLSRTLT